MYKAIFKRDVYIQVPKAVVYYNRPHSAVMMLELDEFKKNYICEDGRLKENISIWSTTVTDVDSDREPIKEEKVIEDFKHVLKVGDIINMFCEKTYIKKVIVNENSSIEYQVSIGIIKHDDYYNLKSIEVENLKNFNDKTNDIIKESKPELIKKKSFLSRWFS